MVVVHFGGSADQENYLDIYESWNATFRIYSPQAEYFGGSWAVSTPVLVANGLISPLRAGSRRINTPYPLEIAFALPLNDRRSFIKVGDPS